MTDRACRHGFTECGECRSKTALITSVSDGFVLLVNGEEVELPHEIRTADKIALRRTGVGEYTVVVTVEGSGVLQGVSSPSPSTPRLPP